MGVTLANNTEQEISGWGGVGKVKLIPFTDLTLLKKDRLQDNSSQFWTKLCGQMDKGLALTKLIFQRREIGNKQLD